MEMDSTDITNSDVHVNKEVTTLDGGLERELIAVDVGYGYVKALTSLIPSKRLSFPSLYAPDSGDKLGVEKFFRKNVGYKVRISGSNPKRYLVGELATTSELMTSVIGPDKPLEVHDLFLLTAVYLMSVSNNPVVDLAIGLPLSYYRNQAEPLLQHLLSLNATVSVDDGPEREISFGRVVIVPQGVGVVVAEGLPDGNGYAGIIDIGQYTTDFLLMDLKTMLPLMDASGSIPRGLYLIEKYMADAYLEATGETLNPQLVSSLLQSKGLITYEGSTLDLSNKYREARKAVSETIAREVLNVWANYRKNMKVTYIAGGGALLLGDLLEKHFPSPSIVEDPVFANARGFMTLALNVD